jgi:hypothetical protein
MNLLSVLLVVPGIGGRIIARQQLWTFGYALGGPVGQPEIEIQRPTLKLP